MKSTWIHVIPKFCMQQRTNADVMYILISAAALKVPFIKVPMAAPIGQNLKMAFLEVMSGVSAWISRRQILTYSMPLSRDTAPTPQQTAERAGARNRDMKLRATTM